MAIHSLPVEILIHFLCVILISMLVILLINFLVRPTLWTHVNIVILVYYTLNVVLGVLNITLLAEIGTLTLQSIWTLNDGFNLYMELKFSCVTYTYWTGQWILRYQTIIDNSAFNFFLCRETILTSLLFLRKLTQLFNLKYTWIVTDLTRLSILGFDLNETILWYSRQVLEDCMKSAWSLLKVHLKSTCSQLEVYPYMSPWSLQEKFALNMMIWYFWQTFSTQT